MKNILLLSTGGTIASVYSESGWIPGLTAENILGYVPEISNICNVACKNIFSLDSSNIQPEEWKAIAQEIFAGLENYEGVVVLHGTDTMAYTASMLSFMLQNLHKPVILTGSQLPMVVEDTDAKSNLRHAFQAVIQPLQGVYIVFGGKIIRGTRAVKVRTLSPGAFESINAEEAGTFVDGKVVIKDEAMERKNGPTVLDDRFNPNVFLLKLIPGTRPEFFDQFMEMGYQGLVIEGFGLGGIHNVRRDLTVKLNQLLEKGVAVIITSQCLYEVSDLTVYEVGRRVAMEGIIPGYDMTSEAAVTKLMWALGHTGDLKEIKRMMLTDYCGEISMKSAGC